MRSCRVLVLSLLRAHTLCLSRAQLLAMRGENEEAKKTQKPRGGAADLYGYDHTAKTFQSARDRALKQHAETAVKKCAGARGSERACERDIVHDCRVFVEQHVGFGF